jgi:hypothetical protein
LVHSPRTRHGSRAPGLPSQEAFWDAKVWRARRVGQVVSPPVFSQGVQWLIAGWSSPVARQAHNLKVASSNLAPATRLKPVNSKSWRAFSPANSPVAAVNGPIQKMLVNTKLSNQVSSCVGCSMSHAWHMESDVLFAKRSCIKTSVRALRDDRRRRFHRVPIGCVARSERSGRRAVPGEQPSLVGPPKPTSASPAEFQVRSV